MKLHLLLLPLALAACASGESPANTAADTTVPAATEPATDVGSKPVDAARLASHHWNLVDATAADGARIDELFARVDKPVQLDFINNRVAISNTCNRMNGGYRLVGDQLQLEPIAQTQMACPEPLMALDAAVNNRLQGSAGIELTGSEDAPRLTLSTQAGDKLVFSGKPTADTRFGGEGEQMFMEVAAETAPCSHPLIPDMQCLQVRELTYGDDGVVSGKSGDWQPLYQDIEGYTHENGVRNVLRLKRYTVKNPPADGSSIAYVLDMVVESEQVKP